MSESNKQTENEIAAIGHLKYLITLSVVLVILITVFSRRLFPEPLWTLALIISIISFTVSAIASICLYTLPLFSIIVESSKPTKVEEGGCLAGLFLFGLLGLIVGFIGLAIFAIKNLF